MKAKWFIGSTCGRLTLIAKLPHGKWECECSCGAKRIVFATNLGWNTFSCGDCTRRRFSIIETLQRDTSPEPFSGCWLWSGCVGSTGYGAFSAEGKFHLAHRASYEAFIGPIPKGLYLDHLCRVRECVNPQHLEPVTQAENILRGTIGCKTHCVNGHPFDAISTRVADGGRRLCRFCASANSAAYYARRKNSKGENSSAKARI